MDMAGVEQDKSVVNITYFVYCFPGGLVGVGFLVTPAGTVPIRFPEYGTVPNFVLFVPTQTQPGFRGCVGG